MAACICNYSTRETSGSLVICLASLEKSSSFRFSGRPGVKVTSAVIITAITWKAIEADAWEDFWSPHIHALTYTVHRERQIHNTYIYADRERESEN